MSTEHLSCKDRVQDHLKGRLHDLKILWDQYNIDPDKHHPEVGNLNEYGLAFDYVRLGTFSDQKEGYHRYQISWGGPSEEFRFFKDGRIEFWFLDWWDGASIVISDPSDKELLGALFELFSGS